MFYKRFNLQCSTLFVFCMSIFICVSLFTTIIIIIISKNNIRTHHKRNAVCKAKQKVK